MALFDMYEMPFVFDHNREVLQHPKLNLGILTFLGVATVLQISLQSMRAGPFKILQVFARFSIFMTYFKLSET